MLLSEIQNSLKLALPYLTTLKVLIFACTNFRENLFSRVFFFAIEETGKRTQRCGHGKRVRKRGSAPHQHVFQVFNQRGRVRTSHACIFPHGGEAVVFGCELLRCVVHQ